MNFEVEVADDGEFQVRDPLTGEILIKGGKTRIEDWLDFQENMERQRKKKQGLRGRP